MSAGPNVLVSTLLYVGGRFLDVSWQTILRLFTIPRDFTHELTEHSSSNGGGGFLEVVRQTSLPLRLLEVGAAGGLILRWDQYRYEAGHEGWGDSHSPVRITDAFDGEHPCFDVLAKIEQRRGCDVSPIEPGTEEGRLTLQSYVWPDQVERFRHLAAAIDVARRVPAHVDQGNAPHWVETALADGVPGVATVVYHSIVWQYLSNLDRARFERVMAVAGEAATHDKPLAWLRFEPADNTAEVRLRLWPGGEDRLLARSGFHGKPVHWLRLENWRFQKRDCF